MENFMINIFTIATNKYKTFLNPFYKSFNEKFLLEEQKQFYIFTDDINHEVFYNKNTKGILINHEQWPHITLNRYKNIKSILNNLTDDNDLCFFVDADMEVVEDIAKILLPSEKKYIGVLHPGNVTRSMNESLETNPNSSAYVDVSTIHPSNPYIQGCLWGARKKDFEYMINTLDEMVKKDLNSNIIAKWHDESHLNKFKLLNEKEFAYLTPDFCYPENWSLPESIERTIIHKDKNYIDFPRFHS
jgi:hypothetical protein